MTRPTRNQDQQLLAAGKKILLKEGISGLSLRAIATKAGVNPGMFHYHFKTKDQFTRALLDHLYGGLLETLNSQITALEAVPDTFERLKKAISGMGAFAIENRELWGALVKELLAGSPIVIAFAREKLPNIFRMMGAVVAECQKLGHLRKDLTPMQILVVFGAVLNAPVVLGSAIASSVGITEVLEKQIFTPEYLAKRIEILLQGLRP